MTYKDIYNDLKNGFSFKEKGGLSFLFIGYSTQQIDYGKEYIFWQNYGQSAMSVSYRNLCWIMSNIFEMKANNFYNAYEIE